MIKKEKHSIQNFIKQQFCEHTNSNYEIKIDVKPKKVLDLLTE